MMRVKETRKRDVVSMADAETVGRVADFVIDPRQGRIAALRLDKVAGDGRYVSWDDLQAFGQDAVTIPSQAVLRPADGERERRVDKDFSVLGKRVLTDAGRELGAVTDVEFDPRSGAVTALFTDREQIDGARLLGIGSYAVVVRREQR